MSEPYIHTRSPDLPPAAESGPIFIFHGEVHGFTYSANPQGDLVSCMMVNDPANLTSPSGKLEVSLQIFNYFFSTNHDFAGSTSWSKSLRQDRRHNTSRAQSSGTASQTRNFRPSEFSDPSVYVPPPSSSSFEGNQDAESNTTPTGEQYHMPFS